MVTNNCGVGMTSLRHFDIDFSKIRDWSLFIGMGATVLVEGGCHKFFLGETGGHEFFKELMGGHDFFLKF